jgi:hypothetical protein
MLRNVMPSQSTLEIRSPIFSGFPIVFFEFHDMQFSLPGRGGRDFHSCCDGHTKILTLIEDINENIFGGFTPLECESSRCSRIKFKANKSLEIFLFTLHHGPAKSTIISPKQDSGSNSELS